MNRIFKPNFRYTDKIVKNLVDIASAREAVLNSYLIPKWEVSLRKDALMRDFLEWVNSGEAKKLDPEIIRLEGKGRGACYVMD